MIRSYDVIIDETREFFASRNRFFIGLLTNYKQSRVINAKKRSITDDDIDAPGQFMYPGVQIRVRPDIHVLKNIVARYRELALMHFVLAVGP